MKMREQKEVSLFRNVLNKIKYSFQGLGYCFRNESSFTLVTIGACLVIFLGIYFDIEFIEWVLSFGSLALIMVIELINTAIEAVVETVIEKVPTIVKLLIKIIKFW